MSAPAASREDRQAPPSRPAHPAARELVAWLEDLGIGDTGRVGGKNASLGELLRALAVEGVLLPDGFAVTAAAYREYLSANEIEPPLRALLADFDAGSRALPAVGRGIRQLFLRGELPPTVATAIVDAYRQLGRRHGGRAVAVAVRSSATAEDLPEASFAGQQESFLNVRGEDEVLLACRRCYASLFTDRAIAYRREKRFDHLQVALSIGVQVMVRADRAGAGVMFSLDTETGFPRVVVIDAGWGLGETVVQGMIDPDKYVVFKPLLDDPQARPILEKTLGSKAGKLVYGRGAGARTRPVATTRRERESFVLGDDEILRSQR